MPLGLNIIDLPYLIFRLGPIIIVSFFVLQSLLMWDIKGILYLSGLLLTCMLALLANGALQLVFPISYTEEKTVGAPAGATVSPISPGCHTITMGENNSYLSSVPLSLVVYSFTFFYLLIFIFNLANPNPTIGILDTTKFSKESINTALNDNIPVLVLFPFLIIAELAWSNMNNCITGDTAKFLIYSLSAIILGGGGGVLWAVLITSIGIQRLQYITSGNSSVCSRPAKTTYRCKPKA
jgi:hypothetical protein